MKNKQHMPLFHVAKRASIKWYYAFLIRAAAILLALVAAGIITTVLTGLNPFKVFGALFTGAFGSKRKLWVLLRDIAVMLCIAIALTPAYKMRFWNIGGEGQVLIGALAAALTMILLGNVVPHAVLILIMTAASLLAGAVWGVIPALFKAKWNTNETLFTLMMNYVATQITAFFIIIFEVPKGAGQIGIINQSTNAGWFPALFGNQYLLTIVIVLILTVMIFFYLKYSKHGYEISVVGESERTARYIGIKVERVIIRTMALSGAICGIAGLLLVGGINHTITTSLVGGRGFTAVMVAWLAKFNPFTMIATSFLIVFMQNGAGEISTAFGLNKAFSDIITGIILFFIIACEFFINYRIVWNRRERKEEM
ncbi:MAG: ABC transporter permease [Lachnospiraceae bacterium]|nr:ABC transporter permease [Lachnospiraceae bacterium]